MYSPVGAIGTLPIVVIYTPMEIYSNNVFPNGSHCALPIVIMYFPMEIDSNNVFPNVSHWDITNSSNIFPYGH